MSVKKKITQFITALFGASMVGAGGIVWLLPSSPGGLGSELLLMVIAFCFVAIGPFGYPLMFPQQFQYTAPNVFLVIATFGSVISFLLWTRKRGRLPLLFVAVMSWVAVGSFIAFFGIAAGI